MTPDAPIYSPGQYRAYLDAEYAAIRRRGSPHDRAVLISESKLRTLILRQAAADGECTLPPDWDA